MKISNFFLPIILLVVGIFGLLLVNDNFPDMQKSAPIIGESSFLSWLLCVGGLGGFVASLFYINSRTGGK